MAEIIGSLRCGLANGSLSLPHLVEDTLHYPNRAVINRLGYILSRNGVDKDVLDALRGRVRRTGYPPYLSRVEAHRDPDWNVMVHYQGTSSHRRTHAGRFAVSPQGYLAGCPPSP